VFDIQEKEGKGEHIDIYRYVDAFSFTTIF